MDSTDDGTAERLARIEVKLDLVLSRYEDHEIRIRSLEKGEEVSNRLGALERWRYSIPANIFVSLSAIVIAVIPYLF